jgi:hypothetical protein
MLKQDIPEPPMDNLYTPDLPREEENGSEFEPPDDYDTNQFLDYKEMDNYFINPGDGCSN